MASMNVVLLVGNLCADPQMKSVGSTALCEMRMAVSRKYKKGEEYKTDTCYVDVAAWSSLGENCGKYLAKGSSIMVEGRLKFDQWDDKDTGKKRSKLSVVANNVQFLSEPVKREEAPPVADDGDCPF